MSDQKSVMKLIVDRLYFGSRPSPSLMQMNGSILKQLAKRYDWSALERIVEGLALRRDRGELRPTVQPGHPVDLRWLWAKKIELNQCALCEDAYYRDLPTPVAPKDAGMGSIADILRKVG